MTVTLDSIEFEITKKKMKTLRIRIIAPDGRVLVSAPLWMKTSEIEAVLEEKLGQIKDAVQKIQATGLPQRKSEEERLSELLKKLSALSGSDGNALGIDKNTLCSALNKEKSADETAEIILKIKLSRLVPFWEEKTGLYCSSWKIKNVRSYWGKCNVQTRELTFNLSLAEKDDACIEYVVLHELAHIKYPNHGEEFKAFLSEYMPQWKKIRQKLKNPQE